MLPLGGGRARSVLALLLLHAGEVVPADRLIDAVWGEAPPEDAAAALQQHVSRLRKALAPHEVVLTRPPGYLVDPAHLDLKEFRALRDAGRRGLDRGAPEDAAEALRAALGLWRGRPLADLDAVEAVAQLEEEWTEAVELRIDADLALGRHTELIAELRTLVGRHPARERLQGQLMLALYRSGRQAEALDVYAEARRTLDAELGLTPGPELRRLQQAVLDHDPELELETPTRAASAPAPPPGRRRRRRVLAGAATAVIALLVMAGLTRGGGDGTDQRARGPEIPQGGALVGIDADSGRIVKRLLAGRTPAALGLRGGSLWVVDADARTVLDVDPASGEVETLATGATPIEVAVGAGGVWVANGRPDETAQTIGPIASEVVRYDAATRTQRATIALPEPDGAVIGHGGTRLAVGAGAVWAVAPSGAVVRIDPASAAVTSTNRRAGVIAVAASEGGVWALRPDGVVLELDPRTARTTRRTRLPTSAPTAVAAGPDAAWVASAADGTLWRVGPDGRPGAAEVGSGASAVTAGASGVWVANAVAGTLTEVDPATMRVTRTVEVGGIPRGLALDGRTVWVAVEGDVATAATESTVQGVRPLPEATCEPPMTGPGGRADVLIVSDLPLQGGVRITATQMSDAIRFVLRERGFRAGRHRVAYQSCDDSIARTGLFDEAKCAANARAYGRHPDVVAVIGTLNSPCAVAAVPELNRAPGGPLAMVSPLNSFPGLTREGPGVDPRLLATLYPTGRRNYLRVYPTDDLQGAALALLARDRGRRSVFVLDDGEPGYGALMAEGFRVAARNLDLGIAGRATWEPRARSYRRLAERVAESDAQAVFVGGLLDTNAARVIRDVRAAAGPDVDVMGPDGLTPLPLLAEKAGDAARGVLVSLGGLVPERLPPAGADFVRRFARTQPGAEIEPSAVYAAQATEVVLDALGRSDGSRAHLLDELFRTRVRDGLLGDFRFDRNGDVDPGPVTVIRLVERGESNRVASAEGGVVERVLRPPARLVTEAG